MRDRSRKAPDVTAKTLDDGRAWDRSLMLLRVLRSQPPVEQRKKRPADVLLHPAGHPGSAASTIAVDETIQIRGIVLKCEFACQAS